MRCNACGYAGRHLQPAPPDPGARALPCDLRVDWLRGNVNTRLAKLDDGQYDAIILAASGLLRLGFDERAKAPIAPEECLPAIGQGVLGIEIRSDDSWLRDIIAPLADAETTLAGECRTRL